MGEANGFVVLCSWVNNTEGLAKSIAVPPGMGLTVGAVAVLRGVRLRPGDPHFALNPGDLQVVDALRATPSG